MFLQLLVLIVWEVSAGQVADGADWQKVAPQGAGFEVLMPDKPKIAAHEVKPLPDRTITVHLATTSTLEGKALFMVAFHDLDFDVTGDEKIRDVLDGGIKGSLLNALGKLTKHERIKLGEYPGRHFEYVGKRFDQKIQASSRIYLAGRRVYQITVIRAPEVDVAAETTKFFESFKLVAVEKPPQEAFSSDGQAPAEPAPDAKPKSDGGK
jgi:hypothetical protein